MEARCPHCGAKRKTSSGERFCGYCGKPLATDAKAAAPAPTSELVQPAELGNQKLGCGAIILRGLLWGLGIAIVLLLVELVEGPQPPDNPVAREIYDFTAEVVGHFVTNVIIYGLLATAVVGIYRGARQRRTRTKAEPETSRPPAATRPTDESENRQTPRSGKPMQKMAAADAAQEPVQKDRSSEGSSRQPAGSRVTKGSVYELAGCYTILIHSDKGDDIDWVFDRIQELQKELGEEGVAEARLIAETDAERWDRLNLGL